MLKCNLDYGNDEKLKALKVKLNQYEETYEINFLKLKFDLRSSTLILGGTLF